jgi:hypothetical protein
MTTTTTSDKITTFKFKVGDDLQVINKVISVLDLAPSDYNYNAKEGTITTSKTNKEFIQKQVKALGFEFLLGTTTVDSKQYKTETITIEKPYVNFNSINIAHNAVYDKYKQDNYKYGLTIVETKIDHTAKTVTVTANVRTSTFNELDYKVALILTNFSYITTTNNTTSSTEQEAYDKLYESIDKLIDRVSSDFDKSAPKELKTLISLFL